MHKHWLNVIALLAIVVALLPAPALAALPSQAITTQSPVSQSPDGQVETPAATEAVVQAEAAVIEQIEEKGQAGYLVYFRDRPNLDAARNMDRTQQGRFVMEQLQATAARAQERVKAFLDRRGVKYTAFWIDNVIIVEESDVSVFNELRRFSEISIIRGRRTEKLVEPVSRDAADAPEQVTSIEPNISHVQAPDVWALGITGAGSVVSSIDTGVRYTHQALVGKYRGNLGGGVFNHNYNWWDPYGNHPTAPADDNGHGSHTMGTMVGDDGSANQIGMAPGAKWLACRGCSTSDCTDAALLECAQFIAAPWDLNHANPNPDMRPDVVNNSWGDCSTSYDSWYRTVVDNWRAAGIYPVFSNGNSSNCGYTVPPACGTVGNPARYGNVTGVGATGQSNGAYATFSLRGPTDNADTENGGAYPTIKPQVAAPGTNIRSSVPTSDTSYEGGWSGTSMAAPHVSGLTALIFQAAPCLKGNFTAVENILQQSAAQVTGLPANSCSGEGPSQMPNQSSGWGEIRALAAVQLALASCGPMGTLAGTVTAVTGGAPIPNATVEAVGTERTVQAKTDATGHYSMSAPVGSYTVNVSAYAYMPVSFTGVAVAENQTTTQNAALEAAPSFTVSGKVSDPATGWGLYAKITIGGYPGAPIWTDPATGNYSIVLVAGQNYAFAAEAFSAGYLPNALDTGVLTANVTLNIPLTADANNCVAPGYVLDVTGVYETFEADTFPPAGWTVTNNGGACVWVGNDPGADGNLTGGTGKFADADADSCGSGTTMNTTLTSPVMNVSTLANINLSYNYDYNNLVSTESADLDVSRDGGATWTNVHHWNTDMRGPGTFTQDVTALLGGATQAQLRYHYIAPGWDWWWQVDNVFVGEKICRPIGGGGLVVGRVADANDNHALVGAKVTTETAAQATAVATDDPAMGNFYVLFQPAGDHTLTATMQKYSSAQAAVTVATGSAVRQDFALQTGHLTYTPPSIEATIQAGTSTTVPMTVQNIGGGPTTFSLAEVNKGSVPFAQPPASGGPRTGLSVFAAPNTVPVAAGPWQATGDVNLALDDGTMEDSVGVNSTSAAFQFIWLNRFTPAAASFPFTLDTVSVFWPTGQVAAGNAMQLVVYEDTDADGDPHDAVLVGAQDVTVQSVGAWNDYALTSPIALTGPGDVLIGFVDRFVTSGTTAPNYPAALDTTASAGRSWIGWWVADPPNPPALPPDTTFDTVDALGLPGNFMVRGSGMAGGVDVPWLSETPATAITLGPGESVTINVTLDSAAVMPGIYNAEIKIVHDTPYALPNLPVKMIASIPPNMGKIAGTVTTNGYCDMTDGPLANMPVVISSATLPATTVNTDANGYYYLWTDVANAPLTVSVNAGADYATAQASGVLLAGSQTTTQDFTLRYLKPCLSASPSAYTVNLTLGQKTTRSLKLTNAGGAAADFTASDASVGGPLAQAVNGNVVHGPSSAGKAPQPTNPQPQTGSLAELLAGVPAYAVNLFTSNLVSITTDVPGTETVVGSVGADDYYAGDFLGNDFSKLYALDYTTKQLVTFSTTDAARTVIGAATPQGSENWTGLTGGPGGTLYATAAVCGTSSALYSINPTTGAATLIGSLGSAATCAIDVAANDAGELYAVDIVADNLVKIDPATGTATTIGSIGISANYAQGMDFDTASGILYYAAYNGTTSVGELRTIDITTGATTLIGAFAGSAEYDAFAIATSGSGGGDALWLTETPESGTLAADSFGQVTLTFDANQVNKPGQYVATVLIESNDPESSPIKVPATMNVTALANWGTLKGTIKSLGYCDANPAPLAGATVVVTGGVGVTRTIKTGSDGTFEFWLPDYANPYTLSASFVVEPGDPEEYLPASATGIVVVGMGNTTQDLNLRWLQPCVTATPEQISKTVEWKQSASQQMTLANAGAVATPFKIKEMPGQFVPMGMTANQILIVNDGGSNTSPANAFKTAMDNLGYTSDVVSSSSTTGIPATMTNYMAVLYAGVPSTGAEITQLTAYLDAGGRLVVADNDFGYTDKATPLYTTYFEATYVADAGSDGLINGVDLEAGTNVDISSDPYPDSFKIGPDAIGIFANTSPRVDWAGMRIARNAYRAVYFPWDYYYAGGSAVGDAVETQIMGNIMPWLTQSDVDWLSATPDQGSLAANTGSQAVNVTVNSNVPSVLQPGTYTAALQIETSDPQHDKLSVPVTMIVNPPANFGKVWGVVRSLGSCDLNPTPLSGAQVQIVAGAQTITVKTDGNGYYQYWLTAATGVQMSVTAAGQLPATRTVDVAAGTPAANQQNFDLHAQQPCATFTPSSFTATVNMGAASAPLPGTVGNTGYAQLSFSFRGAQTGFIPMGGITAGEDVLLIDGTTTATDAVAASLTRLGYTYDRKTFSAAPPVASWTDYAVVIWSGSASSTTTYGPAIKSYLDAGGRFLMAYYDFGYYFKADPLYTTYFEATYIADSGSDGPITGADIMAGVNLDISADPYPDSFSINGPNGVALFTNTAPRTDLAGMRIAKNGYKAIYLAWNFENTGTTNSDKDAVLSRSLNWLAPSATWIQIVPTTGTVDAGATAGVQVTLNAADPAITQPGTYQGELKMSNNTPGNGMIAIPVTMVVNPLATWGKVQGTVKGLGYCDAAPAPLADALVTITAGSATVNLKTDAAGHYSYWFDAAVSPVSIAVSATDHMAGSASATIPAGGTVTKDFNLRWLKPCSSTDTALFDVTLPVDGTLDKPLKLFNKGAAATDWELVAVAVAGAAQPITTAPVPGKSFNGITPQFVKSPDEQKVVPSKVFTPQGPVNLQVDDGAAEDSIGLTDGGQFIWMNRFTPAAADFPFELEQISILWPSGQMAAGSAVELVVYQDTDGDGDPNDAQLMKTYNVTIQNVNGTTWDNYTLPETVLLGGPGDVLIGAINRWNTGAVEYPANIDQTASQGRSWVGIWTTYPPEPPVLPPDSDFGTIDSMGLAGNWLIRASGSTAAGVTWLTVDPAAGNLAADSQQQVNVHFDASVPEVDTGVYLATLRYKTADPVLPTISMPVTMTVGQLLTLTKQVDATYYTGVGEVFNYTLVATNASNRTLTGVSISDSLLSTLNCTQPVDLGPGETLTCTGSYTTVAGDVKADYSGAVVNTATVTAMLWNSPLSATATATVPQTSARVMSIYTTCEQFAGGGAGGGLAQVVYTVAKNRIRLLNPSSLIFYEKIVAPASNFVVTVSQSNTGTWVPLQTTRIQGVVLYNANCTRATVMLPSVDPTTGAATLTINGATPGAAYYAAVKYSAMTLINTPAAVPYPTVWYNFLTATDGVPTPAGNASVKFRPR